MGKWAFCKLWFTTGAPNLWRFIVALWIAMSGRYESRHSWSLHSVCSIAIYECHNLTEHCLRNFQPCGRHFLNLSTSQTPVMKNDIDAALTWAKINNVHDARSNLQLPTFHISDIHYLLHCSTSEHFWHCDTLWLPVLVKSYVSYFSCNTASSIQTVWLRLKENSYSCSLQGLEVAAVFIRGYQE